MSGQIQTIEEGGDYQIVPTTVIGSITRAEIDSRIATAKQWPRSLARFKAMAKEMAVLDEEVAASCFYAIPRGGKTITGPSVRLAEIVGSAWGNLGYGARIVADDGKIVTAQGVCHDLERNVAASIEVQRRVTDKNGRRFSDDMVIVTCNAACSIALRNAIFKVIPKAYVSIIEREVRAVAIGDASTLTANRDKMVAYFGKMGLTPARVFAAVGRRAIDDIGLDELATLKGMATAIKDGDISVDEAFPTPGAIRPELAKGKEVLRRALAPVDEPKPEPEPAKSDAEPDAPLAEDVVADPADVEKDDQANILAEEIASAQSAEDALPVTRWLAEKRAWLGEERHGRLQLLIEERKAALMTPAKSQRGKK